jgi:carboxylate-amine ligase
MLRSVEVEYWVIDDEGRLTEPGDLTDASAGAEREFVEPLLEIKTTPCETTAELRDELLGRVGRVLRRAEDTDKGLVPLGTPVLEEDIRQLPCDRTRVQNRAVGNSFEYVRHCAGTHVHVEQEPGHEVDQLNTLTALDPALALVNSSPYFRGRRTAVGARSKIYRWMAYDRLPRQGRLWSYSEDTKDWDRRLREGYEAFLEAAKEAGVSAEAVEDNFTPESAVWTPVKLRETFSTVEWRSPDNAVPSQVLRLADDVVSVVETAVGCGVSVEGKKGRVTDEAVVLPEYRDLKRYVEEAILEGISSEDLRSYLERMGFDTEEYEPVTGEVDSGGSVTKEEARRLRKEHADRLRTDVQRAASVGSDRIRTKG